MDEEKIQFVADIITPRTDPGNIYVLSSRFHKYFLKNLDKNDINVRIMRIPDTTKEGHSLGGSTVQPLSLITPGFTKAPPPLPAQPLPSYTSSPGVSTSYAHYTQSPYQFDFNHKRPVTTSPYQFESPAIVNKDIRNPFLLLNSGERPSIFNNDVHRNYDTHSGVSQSSAYYFANTNHA